MSDTLNHAFQQWNGLDQLTLLGGGEGFGDRSGQPPGPLVTDALKAFLAGGGDRDEHPAPVGRVVRPRTRPPWARAARMEPIDCGVISSTAARAPGVEGPSRSRRTSTETCDSVSSPSTCTCLSRRTSGPRQARSSPAGALDVGSDHGHGSSHALGMDISYSRSNQSNLTISRNAAARRRPTDGRVGCRVGGGPRPSQVSEYLLVWAFRGPIGGRWTCCCEKPH